MDSINAMNVAGTPVSSATDHKKINRTRKNDAIRLRNFLFKQFELYMTMGIDRHINFSNVNVRYNAKGKHFVINNGQTFSRITKLAWHLRLHYGIQSPNGKSEWVVIEPNSNSGLKS